MALREPAIEQPKEFKFASATLKRAEEIIAKYPNGRQQSAVMPILDIVQRQCGGWLPVVAMNAIADLLDMPYIKVYEVASFYTMYNLEPVGEHLIQVCRTTPCWLRGSDKLTKACKKKLDVDIGGTSSDGKFTLVEVECLGACVNAPMVQINDNYFEDLTTEQMEQILDDLAENKKIQIGTQINRQTSAPTGELTSLHQFDKEADKLASLATAAAKNSSKKPATKASKSSKSKTSTAKATKASAKKGTTKKTPAKKGSK